MAMAIVVAVLIVGSVLWFGALGDRYGRKTLAVVGTILAIPFSLLAAFAPSDTVLGIARVGGGLSAGMAFPTTLALITALWSGQARTKAIALWSGLGAAISALGPLGAGFLLEDFSWGSLFLLTLPLALVAIPMAWVLIPAHVNETKEPVDNLGGILSVVLIGATILAINFAPVPNKLTATLVLAGIAVVALALFFLRQRRARSPLYDLKVAARPTFWVGAVAGIIVFGSLMGALFIGQQFLQNVLGYSTLGAGAAILPAAFCMVLVAPRSAKLTESHGTRICIQLGQVILLLGFLAMLLLWKENVPYWKVGLGYALVGLGVGLAGPPTSAALTGSVPVKRVGMASGTADLQRDLGLAMLFITHNAGALSAVADKTLVMRQGEVVAHGTIAKLQASGDEYVQGILFPEKSLANAAPAQDFHVFLSCGMLPHLNVHRGRHDHRRRRCQVQQVALFCRNIERIIFDLKSSGIGILVTDHNVRETLSVTDRAYIINEGRIFRTGTPEQLGSDPEVRRVYLGESFSLV